MILTANSEIARHTRRKTGNGWHTTFIGENRNTLKQGQQPPEAGVLYPKRANEVSCASVIEETPDGMATWRYRLPPRASVSGPDPRTGGGQFWIVLSGSASVPASDLLPPNSCVFVGPGDAALAMTAGDGGAETLCLQFPVLARH